MNNRGPEAKIPDEDDIQIIVDGVLRHGRTADVIEFSIYILRFELRFTVTIPEEGTVRAPVYIKHRINKRRTI